MSEPKVKPGYHQNRDDRDLTERDRQVLTLMHRGMNMAEAGRELDISRARVSAVVKKLEERGYVRREGRKVIVDVERLIG